MATENGSIFSRMAALVFLAPLSMAWAQGEITSSAKSVNPHTESANCEVCHMVPEAELKSLSVPGSKMRSLRADLVTVCRQCHGVGFGHGVGKKPEMNRESLPLDTDGTITCAITCHSMHLKDATDWHQKRYHLRLPIEKLCISCHNK